MRQFNEAVHHAKMTGQEPTEWFVSKAVHGVYVGDERRDLTGGPEIIGLPVKFDADLPMNKVVLKAGRNTVSAFVVPLLIDLDNS